MAKQEHLRCATCLHEDECTTDPPRNYSEGGADRCAHYNARGRGPCARCKELEEVLDSAADNLRMIRKDCQSNCVHMGDEAKSVFILVSDQIAEPLRTLRDALGKEWDDG